MESRDGCLILAHQTEMKKKSLLIIQTETFTETIFTDTPKVEINRLMQLHHKELLSIIFDGKLIYMKNKT